MVECLLRNPATDPNVQAESWEPCPLYSALRANNMEVAHLLLADPRVVLRPSEDDRHWDDGRFWDICPELFCRVIKDPLFDFALADPDPVKYIMDRGYEDDSLPTLLSNPNYDVNKHGYFAKFCKEERASWIIETFLAHPRIDVNMEHPFDAACFSGDLRIVEYLLADPRTVMRRPVWNPVRRGYLEILKRLLFSGVDVDFQETPFADGLNLIETSEQGGGAAMVALLRSYQSDPIRTKIRIGLEYTLKLFALVVLLSDGYLGETAHPKKIGQWEAKRRRFFRIALKLPMELQMLVCHRVSGSPQDSISSFGFEAGFRSLQL